MSFSLANQIRINNKAANLDIRYGPWLTEAAAKDGIVEGLREKGLTVGIYVPNNNTNSPVVEYWWRDGVTNNDLIVKGGELVTNTDFNNYKTSVASATATALQTLSYNDANTLSISNGNNVTLGTFADITVGTINGASVLHNEWFNVLFGSENGVPTRAGNDPETGWDTGARNTSVGYAAGQGLTTGYHNVFVGTDAGQSILSGHDNVAVGHSALNATNHGSYNTALGVAALANNSTGIFPGRRNIGVGWGAGIDIQNGNDNIVVGYLGQVGQDKSNNIVIGKQASSSTYDNTVVIGTSATATADNTLTFGSTSMPLSATLHGSLTVAGTVSAQSTIYTQGQQVVKTPITSTSGLSAVSLIVAVSALPATQEPGTLYILI